MSELLKNAMAEYNMSARAYDRILKVSRTIADLAASDRITADHVSEAIQPEFRSGLACGPGQVVAQTGSLRCRGLAARLRPGTFSNRCSPQPAPPIANRQTRQTASLRYFVAAQFRSSGSIAFAGTGSCGDRIRRNLIRALNPRTTERLLSRPAANLSSIRNGGEGRGEEALGFMERKIIPPVVAALVSARPSCGMVSRVLTNAATVQPRLTHTDSRGRTPSPRPSPP